jgi:hypothetical protein
VNFSAGEQRAPHSTSRAPRAASARSAAHPASPQKSRACEHVAPSESARPASFDAWGRISEPRLKRADISPGPGAYSPAAPTSSVAVKFGRSVNHKLPFRASYCEENFVSHQAIPGGDKLFGSASGVSFPRLRRDPQLTATAGHGATSAACSPFIGPGTYNVQLGAASAHSIPVGPRGGDLRAFRNNRALRHTYSSEDSDAIIGLPPLLPAPLHPRLSALPP